MARSRHPQTGDLPRTQPHPRQQQHDQPVPRRPAGPEHRDNLFVTPEEIRDPGDLSSPAPTTDRELEIAELLMTEMTGVDITELHDDYAQALNLLVDTLAAGGQTAPPVEPQPPVDLMAALEASVRDARRARNGA
ncbi:hypothetical protein [Streptomyces sp. NPDC054765]